MKKKWIKPLVLTIVFALALLFFNIITKQSSEDMTTAMPQATLPIMYFAQDGVQINEMHGYSGEMDATSVRENITPIAGDRMVSLTMDSYGREITGLSYEIRSLDAERLVANMDLTEQLTNKGNRYLVDFQVQTLIEEHEEYLMIFHLLMGEEEVCYYSRIMRSDDYYAKECLDFALEFHGYTFREDASEFIPTYIDPATGDTTTLSYVDLSCTLKQITWAKFDCEKITTVVPSYKEINSSYNVITLDYVVSHTTDTGEMEYYNVEEYYRLRQTDSRMYVLNFERRMNQIFLRENTFLVDKSKILLGIRDMDVEYAANESGDIVTFVQEGDLWRFSQATNDLTKVFSFRGEEGIDRRENWQDYAIRIMNVDEVGSVDFIVYGYMNRGTHEGKVGIAVYRYDGISHTVEEEVFIPMDCSYDVLRAELGQLMYESDLGYLYLMLDGAVYRIDVNTLESEVLIHNLKDGCYAASESNRFFAWVEEGNQFSSGEIQIMDLKTGERFKTDRNLNCYQLPLGFVGEDLVYGVAAADEVWMDAAGNVTFPMFSLKIMAVSEEGHRILKNYQPKGRRVANIKIENYLIRVNLAEVSTGYMEVSGFDTIMNQEADEKATIYVDSSISEVKERQVQLVMRKACDSGKIRQIVAKHMIVDEIPVVKLDLEENSDRFYVYTRGQVDLVTDRIQDAIAVANEDLGVVVDRNQNYVWMRARNLNQTALTGLNPNEGDEGADSIAMALSILLHRNDVDVTVHTLLESGQTPRAIMNNYLKNSTVLDLSGCAVDEVLFYVSNGNPVFALTDSDRGVLVVGYTTNSVYLYDPKNKKLETVPLEKAEELFENCGNVFLSYLN